MYFNLIIDIAKNYKPTWTQNHLWAVWKLEIRLSRFENWILFKYIDYI